MKFPSDCKVLTIVGRVKSKLLVLMSWSTISIGPRRKFFQNSSLPENPFGFNRPRSALASFIAKKSKREMREIGRETRDKTNSHLCYISKFKERLRNYSPN